MREIKFRYRILLENRTNFFYYTIQDIEKARGLNEQSLKEVNGKILSRDQFTGLHDKNGKEIYEGDILRGGKSLWEVVYDKTSFMMRKIPKSKINFTHESLIFIYDETEVIGNIWENPELMQ